MVVEELIVKAGYEGTDLTRGLQKSAGEVQRFQQQFNALGGNARAFTLPDLSNDSRVAVTHLKSMGVAIADVHRELKSAGIIFDQTFGKFRDLGTGRLLTEVQAMEAASTVIQKLKTDAQALQAFDDAVRRQVSVLTEGVRLANTQGASLRELRTIYAQISRDLATTNPPLERRIALERELVKIRKEFAAVTAASRPTVATDFAASVPAIERVGRGLDVVEKKNVAVRRSFALVNRETGEFTALGRKASGAAIGIGFGLEALARGGVAAEGGLRTALRTVASFAAFFGPKGLIVSGVAAATAAIIDLATRSKKELDDLKQKFETDLTEMVRNADTAGLQRELQKLTIGELKLDPSTGLFAFTDGLDALNAKLDELERKQRSAFETNVNRSGFTEQGKQIRELRAQIAPLQERYDLLKRTIENFPTLPREIKSPTPIRVTGKSDADLQAEAFEALKDRIDNVTASAEQLTQDIKVQVDLGGQMVLLHDELARRLKLEKDLTSATAVEIRNMLNRLKEFGEVQNQLRRREFPLVPNISVPQVQDIIDDQIRNAPKTLTIPIELKPSTSEINLRAFEDAVERVKKAQGLLDFSKLTGDASFQRESEQRLKQAEQRLQDFSRNVVAFMTAVNIPLESQRKIMAELVRLSKGLKDADPASNLAANIRDITTAARGVVSTAEAVDLIGENAARSLNSVLLLADALTALDSDKLVTQISGALGVIGAVGTFLNSVGVLGESPAEKERNRILQANNDELERLRLELSGFTKSIRQQLDIADRLDRLRPAIARFATADSTIEFSRARDQLNRDVLAAGFTYKELAVLAREFGVEILTANGKIIPEALNQFAEHLRLAADAAFRFTNSFEDRRQAMELLNRAGGLPSTAEQIITDAARLFQEFAPRLWERFFAGVNLNDAGAMRQAIVEFLKKFLDPASTIERQLFGDLTNRSEIIAIIEAWLTGIEKMTDAANNAVEAILGLPNSFRIERARFEATAPEINRDVIRAGTSTPIVPTTPSPLGQGGGVIPPSGTSMTIVVHQLDIHAEDRPIAVAFDEMKELLTQKARAQGGLYAKPSEAWNN